MMANEEPLTVAEMAQHWKKSEYMIREYAKSGELPAHKIGREWRFFLSEVHERLTARVTDSWALPSKRKGMA